MHASHVIGMTIADTDRCGVRNLRSQGFLDALTKPSVVPPIVGNDVVSPDRPVAGGGWSVGAGMPVDAVEFVNFVENKDSLCLAVS